MPECAYQDRPGVWPGKCFRQAAIASRLLEFRIDDRVPPGQASGEAANHSRVQQQGAISGLEAGRQGETIPGPSWQFSQLACHGPTVAEIRPQKLSHVALPQSKPEATNAGDSSMTVSGPLAHPRTDTSLHSPKIYQAADFKTQRHHTQGLLCTPGACSHLPTLQIAPLFAAPRQRNKSRPLAAHPHRITTQPSSRAIACVRDTRAPGRQAQKIFCMPWIAVSITKKTEETGGPWSDRHAFIPSLSRRLFIPPYEASLLLSSVLCTESHCPSRNLICSQENTRISKPSLHGLGPVPFPPLSPSLPAARGPNKRPLCPICLSPRPAIGQPLVSDSPFLHLPLDGAR